MKIQVYSEGQKSIWDDFVKKSKNGTFLFQRDYMDYHRDRFADHSLLVWDDSATLVALLPANRSQDRLASHAGLTYGGFITDTSMKTPIMLQVFEQTLAYLHHNGFSSFLYKTIPHIYTRVPAEEDRYALFLCRAKLIRSGVLTVVNSQQHLPFQERRCRGVKKALKNHLRIQASEDFPSFWEILKEVLWKTYQTHPVHALDEIIGLHSRFPDNIRLYASMQNDEMLAGVVVYESERVARSQYIATSEKGKTLGALDLVFDHLLNRVYDQKPFFDFGTSDDQEGQCLNSGLIDQKEGFGARAVMHDHFEIPVSQYVPGQFVGAIA